MNINQNNYEDFLIRKMEGQLNTEENTEVDLFLDKHPELVTEWESLRQTILVADEKIIFPNKELLKKPLRRGVVPLYRNLLVAMSVAATITIILFISFFHENSVQTVSPVAVENGQKKNTTPFVIQGNTLPENNNRRVAENHPPQKSFKSSSTNSVTVENENPHIIQAIQEPIINNEQHQQAVSVSLNSPEENSTPSVSETSSYPQFVWNMPVRKETQGNESGKAFVRFASAVGSDLVRLSGREDLLQDIEENNPVKSFASSVNSDRFPLYKKLVSERLNKSNNPK